MRVKFKTTRTTKEAEPQTFEAGKVYDLPRASAQHWLDRGVAEEVTEEPKPRKVDRPVTAMVPDSPIEHIVPKK